MELCEQSASNDISNLINLVIIIINLRAMHSTCSRHLQEHFFLAKNHLALSLCALLNDAYSCALYSLSESCLRNNDLPDNLCIAQAVSSTLHFYHSSRKSLLGLHHSSSCTLERENYSVIPDERYPTLSKDANASIHRNDASFFLQQQ